jgi:hypothetical protein
MNDIFTQPTQDTNRSWNLSGGLNLGSFTIVHAIEQRSAVKTAFFVLLIWFGFALSLEFVKYLMSK